MKGPRGVSDEKDRPHVHVYVDIFMVMSQVVVFREGPNNEDHKSR